MPKKIIVISGATACGKSALALELGSYKDIAIINADSLQVYQGLPILSAQPSKTEQEKLPHFLYSHFMPNESCSVGLWLKLVKTAATEIASEGKLPVVVGGSGMYISKLIEGISKMPEVTSEKKQEAAELYETLGHDEFQQQFGEEKIIDRQRLIRACEVFLQSGKPISFWQEQKKEKIFPDTKFTHVNLEIERKKLYQNCNLRFEKMLQAGGLSEAEDLLKLNPKRSWQITKTLGFEEISLFLQNEITHEKMLEIATQKTRNYAKRQMTWFRHQLPEKTNFEDSKAALEFLKKTD